jgi:hypothetical protein
VQGEVMANKNSIYVQSLVDFIRDTKPYHSKLDSVIEIYKFFDTMAVHFDERLFSNTTLKAAWPYSYFSNGVPVPAPVMGLHQVVNPVFRQMFKNDQPLANRGAFKVGRDENTDLPLVPLAFDPKSIQGTGISDAFVQRGGSAIFAEPLLEGHDFHHVLGANVFTIKQTVSSQPTVLGRFNREYTQADGPFPVIVNLGFVSDTLSITGPATQVTLTQITVSGPGHVKVVGLSSLANYAPLFTERQNENLIASTTATVQAQALDISNPNSSVNRLKGVMNGIAAQLLLTPDAASSAALNSVVSILNVPLLPNSYEALLDALIAAAVPVPVGYTGWRGRDVTAPYTDRYVNQTLEELSPGLYFNTYTDVGLRENGALAYDRLLNTQLEISAINADPTRSAYEEFTLVYSSATTLVVTGSSSGVLGVATLPGTFTSAQINFTLNTVPTVADKLIIGRTYKIVLIGSTDFVSAGASANLVGTVFVASAAVNGGGQAIQQIEPDDTFVLTPRASITVHKNAPLESWSLMKVNALSFSRPVFSSTRYGRVISATSVPNFVTVLDQSFQSGTVTMTATSSASFTLTHSAGSYTAIATVNTPFNDGKLAFTIVAGTAYTFQPGDKFFIEIENPLPVAQDLDLYYGFDVGPYDANDMVYDNVNTSVTEYLKTLDFGWDSRFTSYDLAAMNLQLEPGAVDGVQWRLLAQPDGGDLVLGNYSPTGQANLVYEGAAANPNAPFLFDSVNDVGSDGAWSATDPDVVGDLRLFYANTFRLEYYNSAMGLWVTVDTVQINVPYTNSTHGVSFTIVPASKPFIASTINSSYFQNTIDPFVTETVNGGDVIAWTVVNSPPVQTEPASISGPNTPRLIMHGGSFADTIPASYELTWNAANTYTLTGAYTAGPLNGQQVFAGGLSVNTMASGLSFRDDTLGVHYTIVAGAAGLLPSDTFTFNTYDVKPTYLVHGSISGWQPPAQLDKYYWNGKIGFKLQLPKVVCFEGGIRLDGSPWATSVGTITLNRVRRDAWHAVYKLISHVNGHWTLYRDGKLVGDGSSGVSDEYLSLDTPVGVQGTVLEFLIEADEHLLPIGQNLGVVRTTPGRTPSGSDFVLFERAETDTLSISIKPLDVPHTLALQALAPITTDLRFVDLNVLNGGGVLSNTSPETAVLQGWIPSLLTYRDSSSSIAEFKDPTTSVVVRAAATGEVIGTVSSTGVSPAEPVIFTWDSAFAASYLPLNADATVVTLGSGMDERVLVTMTDNALFLVSGGGLLDDALFSETLTVHVADDTQLLIKQSLAEAVQALIQDGPFGGFLPGYDNTPFDFELGGDPNADDVGYYDAGQALTDYFQQAKTLNAINVPSPTQQALLNDLTALLDPYLIGGIAGTTLESFLTALNAEPVVNYLPGSGSFGVPAVGMGMSVDDTQAQAVGAKIDESMVVIADDLGFPLDLGGFDIGPFDEPVELTAILFSSTLPPVPAPLPAITTYSGLTTPLFVPAPGARIIEISFAADIGAITPAVRLWRPLEPAPVLAAVERVGTRVLRISMPAASEVKVIVG